MITVSIKEYGLLEKGGSSSSLSCASLPPVSWDWLLANGSSVVQHSSDVGAELVRSIRRGGQLYLQVVNYCGVLDLPGNVRVEILPKITSSDDVEESRRLLLKMLARISNINLKAFQASSLQLFRRPLIEVLIARFLDDVKHMLKRGLRSDYCRRSEELRFLRGQLRVADQLRQRPGRSHFFQVDYDEYLPDRPENRLIHSALRQISSWSKSPDNQRLCREQMFVFTDVPYSTNIAADFAAWKADRGMAHYQPLKPWCEMILSQTSPLSLVGSAKGISFLFPMEMLFERFVGACLYQHVSGDYQLKEQASSRYLVQHQGNNWFQLKPDFLIAHKGSPAVVMDTKWKLVSESARSGKDKYGLSQSDFYQLFAYGEKYLGGEGEMFLIYPRHSGFKDPLPCFEFKPGLRLWVLPFDLAAETLITPQATSSLDDALKAIERY